MSLLGPAEIRDLAEQLDLQPTKKLGQNFVVDANTVRKIVRSARVEAGDHVLEVGPGLGSLTLGLLDVGAHVTAVEIDTRLATQLPVTAALLAPDAADRLTVITDDAMKVTDLPGSPTRLVANLPYNISVPVLLHLLRTVQSLESALVMVQAEVGQRIAATPGSKVYGSPSVKAAWYGRWSTAGQISRQVFWPVPNVDSILVSFERGERPGSEEERATLFALVDAAFGQRRKMLRQALAELLGGSAAASARLEAAGVDPTLRGEQLSMPDFLAIARVN
ncbi:16S rRNA (adenine(1518)-N(6)/adenine(1519)-N(6))-dimethyltransferaseRsmA [soil metagenome]